MGKTAAVVLFTFSAAQAETVTIAALGDSLTQGYGLLRDDGFVPQLESWLLEQGEEVVLINAGVSGDTTAGGKSRAAWTMTPDVDALILALGGNDVLRGLPAAAARDNLAAILDVARQQDLPVLLVGITAPGNFGAEYKSAFQAIYADLAAEYDTLLYDSFLQALQTPGTNTAAFVQDDGLHPNPEGVKRIVRDMGPSVRQLIANTAH